MVEALLERGAHVDAPSELGTPLQWGAGSGHADVVAALLKRGANANAVSADFNVSVVFMATASGTNQKCQTCCTECSGAFKTR